MDKYRYIHGFVFKKHSKNSEIIYKTKIYLPIINRRVDIFFKYDITDKEVNEMLVSFAKDLKKLAFNLANELHIEALEYITDEEVKHNEELKYILEIQDKIDIFKYIAYNELEVYKDEIIIRCRTEWNYCVITCIKYYKDVIIISRD